MKYGVLNVHDAILTTVCKVVQFWQYLLIHHPRLGPDVIWHRTVKYSLKILWNPHIFEA